MFLALLATGPAAGQGHVDTNVFNGSLTCASAGCHELSASTVDPDSNIQRNEFQVWRTTDKHAQSYAVLRTPQAERIARNLGLGPASQAGMCLDCHAMNVPPPQRGQNFNIAEGVGCESCHGGSGQWLDSHTDFDVTLQELRAQGMVAMNDPVVRGNLCMDCHMGTNEKYGGHRLLAAGHPRVSFELDSYTNNKVHFTIDQDYLERKTYVPGAQTWAIGQALAVERRMTLLADDRTGTIGFFPEFAFFDCHGCHQPQSVKRRSNVNRRGQPKLDDAHMEMLRIAARVAGPGLAERVEQDLRQLHRGAATGRRALVDAALDMKRTATAVRAALTGKTFTSDDMRDILRAVAAAGADGRYADYASAEQTMNSLDSMISALADGEHATEAEITRYDRALGPVFEAVQSDDQYDAARFIRAMQGFEAATR